MRKLSILILTLAAFALPFACSEKESGPAVDGPDTPEEPNGPDGPGDETIKFEVGQYYKEGLAEGIVAYVDESGEHGLLISLDETRAQWSTEYEMLTVMGGEFSWDDGSSNCAYIRTFENWEDLYPAFAWCHEKNVLGLNAWYLPAIGEFQKIMPAVEAINATLVEMELAPLAMGVNDSYWTSVEVGVSSAYAYSFYEGDIASYDLDKLNEHFVRAIRTF